MSAAAAEPAERHAGGLVIRRVEGIPLALLLKRPLHSFAGLKTAARSLLVRIETPDGLLGWGEAGESLSMTGETLDGMRTVIADHLAPRLLGRSALDCAGLVRACAETVYGNTGARAAIEMALLDIAGRHFDVPAVELLGSAVRPKVSPLWFVGAGALKRDVAEAEEKWAQGYAAFKMKAAIEPVDRDIARFRALRNALGPRVPISVDANMGWDVPTACRFVRAVEPLDPHFVEQPVRHDDLPGMATVARASAVPVGADEGIHGRAEVLAHARERVAAGVSLKPCKAGGVAEVVRLAAVADALGLSVHVASLIESSVATAAVLAVGCAASRLDWGISLTNHYLAEDLVAAPLALDRSGAICPPAATGLGVAVDEAQVERFRIR
jgi:muconate cycloisomerase